MRVAPVSLYGGRRGNRIFKGIDFIEDFSIDLLGIVGREQTTSIEQCLGKEKVVEGLGHFDWTVDVWWITALDKGRRQERMVTVTMGEEYVFRSHFVDAQSSIKQQVELGDHEGGIPCRPRRSGEDILLVFSGEPPLKNF